MKLRVVLDPEGDDEVIINAREMTDDIMLLQKRISRLIGSLNEIALYDGEKEIFVPTDDVLYFESGGNKVFAYTTRKIFICKLKLSELEEMLPRSFARASKCCIVNCMKISSMARSLTGVTDVEFFSSERKIVLSRMYYHNVRDKIEEMRLNK